jgi:hypothetical protein
MVIGPFPDFLYLITSSSIAGDDNGHERLDGKYLTRLHKEITSIMTLTTNNIETLINNI